MTWWNKFWQRKGIDRNPFVDNKNTNRSNSLMPTIYSRWSNQQTNAKQEKYLKQTYISLSLKSVGFNEFDKIKLDSNILPWQIRNFSTIFDMIRIRRHPPIEKIIPNFQYRSDNETHLFIVFFLSTDSISSFIYVFSQSAEYLTIRVHIENGESKRVSKLLFSWKNLIFNRKMPATSSNSLCNAQMYPTYVRFNIVYLMSIYVRITYMYCGEQRRWVWV